MTTTTVDKHYYLRGMQHVMQQDDVPAGTLFPTEPSDSLFIYLLSGQSNRLCRLPTDAVA